MANKEYQKPVIMLNKSQFWHALTPQTIMGGISVQHDIFMAQSSGDQVIGSEKKAC